MKATTGDPKGKRALFDPAAGGEGERTIRPTVPAGEAGRQSLFEAAERKPFTVVMHCSECGTKSRLGYGEFLARHFPLWLWIPGRSYSRLLRCTHCERLTWQAVSFLA